MKSCVTFSVEPADVINVNYCTREYLELTTYFFDEKYNKKESDLLIENLNINNEDTILDIPCGYGRLTNILAQKAKKIVGVDINKDFLHIAKQHSFKYAILPTYVKEDIRTFQYIHKFDAAIVAFNSFGIFNDVDNELFIKNLSSNLKDKGRFMIEILNPEYFSSDTCKEFKHLIGNLQVVDQVNYQHDQQILSAKRTYVRSGNVKTEFHQMKVYSQLT